MLPLDKFSLDAIFYVFSLFTMVCSLYFAKRKGKFAWIQKTLFKEDEDEVKLNPDVKMGNVEGVTEFTSLITFKMIQRRFREIIEEIDTNSFTDIFRRHDILPSGILYDLKDLPRRKRAERFLLCLLMSPSDWVPRFMKVLQRRHQKVYCSITECDYNNNGVVTDDSWCNACTRKIIKYIINESMQNANVPLDGGKLSPLLLEELIITPRQYETIMIKKSLSERTEKLLSILDDDYTCDRCLSVFKQAVKEAGYKDCHQILENIMSEWDGCPSPNTMCKGHVLGENTTEKQVTEAIQERRHGSYKVSSTLTDIGGENKEKAIIFKFEVNTNSEEKHDQLLQEFNAGKQSLTESIKGLGEVLSITKGCIAIVVKCNQPDSSSGNIALEILDRMLNGKVPWDALDNSNIKVQICVTDWPKGEDSILLQKKMMLLRQIPVILEEMDALDFEDAFTQAGLFQKEAFWELFGIEHLSRRNRMLALVKFILKNDQTFFDHFIPVIMDSRGTTLFPLRESLSSIPVEPKSAAITIINEMKEPHKSCESVCLPSKESPACLGQDTPVGQQCYKDFTALLVKNILLKQSQIFNLMLRLIVILIVAMTIIVFAIQAIELERTSAIERKGAQVKADLNYSDLSSLIVTDPQPVIKICFPSLRWNSSVCFTDLQNNFSIFNNCSDDFYKVPRNYTTKDKLYVARELLIYTILFTYFYLFVVILMSLFILRKIYKCRRKRDHTSSDERYIYDAFISYADEDLYWVNDNIVKILEGKYKLRTCFPERDFAISSFLTTSIFESIYNSKCVVVVLSDKYVEDVWWHFIKDVAESLMSERPSYNKLIVICRSNGDRQHAKLYQKSKWKVVTHDKIIGDEMGLWEEIVKS